MNLTLSLYTHSCTYICICSYGVVNCTFTNISTYIYIYTHTCTYICICSYGLVNCTFTYISTYIYTHTHTCTFKCICSYDLVNCTFTYISTTCAFTDVIYQHSMKMKYILYIALITSRLLQSNIGWVHSIDSLWPADVVWQHRFESTLAQSMACCLVATKPLPEPMSTSHWFGSVALT